MQPNFFNRLLSRRTRPSSQQRHSQPLGANTGGRMRHRPQRNPGRFQRFGQDEQEFRQDTQSGYDASSSRIRHEESSNIGGTTDSSVGSTGSGASLSGSQQVEGGSRLTRQNAMTRPQLKEQRQQRGSQQQQLPTHRQSSIDSSGRNAGGGQSGRGQSNMSNSEQQRHDVRFEHQQRSRGSSIIIEESSGGVGNQENARLIARHGGTQNQFIDDNGQNLRLPVRQGAGGDQHNYNVLPSSRQEAGTYDAPGVSSYSRGGQSIINNMPDPKYNSQHQRPIFYVGGDTPPLDRRLSNMPTTGQQYFDAVNSYGNYSPGQGSGYYYNAPEPQYWQSPDISNPYNSYNVDYSRPSFYATNGPVVPDYRSRIYTVQQQDPQVSQYRQEHYSAPQRYFDQSGQQGSSSDFVRVGGKNLYKGMTPAEAKNRRQYHRQQNRMPQGLQVIPEETIESGRTEQTGVREVFYDAPGPGSSAFAPGANQREYYRRLDVVSGPDGATKQQSQQSYHRQVELDRANQGSNSPTYYDTPL